VKLSSYFDSFQNMIFQKVSAFMIGDMNRATKFRTSFNPPECKILASGGVIVPQITGNANHFNCVPASGKGCATCELAMGYQNR
jgi:hypothetical protein